MAIKSLGNCYLCDEQFNKTIMKNHLLKKHQITDNYQECYLLKIEGVENKNYWLYIDIPIEQKLSAIDKFLRKIWLECCGHLSAFFLGNYDNRIGKANVLSNLDIGDKLIHEYDFGSTTESLITIVDKIARKPQKEAVRLLARNIPFAFSCNECGKSATQICCECMYDEGNPYYCEECFEKHEHIGLPITNSPRCGECGYKGEQDIFEFKPK